MLHPVRTIARPFARPLVGPQHETKSKGMRLSGRRMGGACWVGTCSMAHFPRLPGLSGRNQMQWREIWSGTSQARLNPRSWTAGLGRNSHVHVFRATASPYVGHAHDLPKPPKRHGRRRSASSPQPDPKKAEACVVVRLLCRCAAWAVWCQHCRCAERGARCLSYVCGIMRTPGRLDSGTPRRLGCPTCMCAAASKAALESYGHSPMLPMTSYTTEVASPGSW